MLKDHTFPSRIRKKTKCPLLMFPCNTVLGVLAVTVRKTINQWLMYWKGGIKLSLFEDSMILGTKNPKEPTKIF